MNNKKYNIKFFLLLALFVVFQNCQSQLKENPKYLGSKEGSIDLDKVTFKENIDTLFSKVPHVELDRTNEKSKAWLYRNKIEDKNAKVSIVNLMELSNNRVDVIADKDKKIQAFTSFIETNRDPGNLINDLDKKYGKYRVKLKPNKRLEFSNSKLYQWNFPDKIYAITISKLQEKEYTVNIAVVKSNIDKNTMSIDLSPICLDKDCKEN
ncbi:hypothetical protein [Chryseobacterium jejuense]|uniref:hypothetical protein n=1 Tax=Chryseobacterium jejuense TaxID=445960 RepID=UPI001AEACDFD|nr:hypothetical protein [Chryseobacterium jejuense]MBP2616009.1 hypothetical protein [Chryseobacterium jejuense]